MRAARLRAYHDSVRLDAVNDAMADLAGGRLQGRGILVPAGAG